MRPNQRVRRRKHTVLPWIVLVVVVALLVGGYVYVSQRSSDDSQSTSDSSEQQKDVPKPQTITDTGLETLLGTYIEDRSATYGVVVKEVARSDKPLSLRTAGYNAQQAFVPASSYKVYVAVTVLQEIENGTYALETQTRTGESIAVCLDKMLVDSDNECGRALGFLVGWKHINELLWAQGISTNTDLYNYVEGSDDPVGDKYTTATDAARIMEGIYDGSLLDDEHTALLLEIMERQAWRERLAAGLPEGTKIVSKPGWLDNIQTDVGIVYGPNSTYVITVLSTEAGPAALAELSTLVYNYLNPSV